MSDEPVVIDAKDKIAAAFELHEQAAAAEAQLVTAGWSSEEITVLVGESGLESLDVSGAEHGIIGRAIRVLQQMGDEQLFLARYAEDLHAGAVVLLIPTGDSDKKAYVHSIVAANGGTGIVYFGSMMIEELPPHPEG